MTGQQGLVPGWKGDQEVTYGEGLKQADVGP